MQRSSRLDLFTIVVAYIGFIGIGLAATSSLLGVAWTQMHTEFGVRLDAVAYVLTSSTIGYLTASFYSGTLAYRVGIGRMMVVGSALLIAALFIVSQTQSFWLMVAVMLFGGFGSGTIDAGLNGYMAQHHGARAMNWLHASFGVGVTIGPLIMTEILKAGLSWRVGYEIIGACVVVLLVLLLLTISWWRVTVPAPGSAPVQRASLWTILRMPVIWIGIMMFFVYAGLEATPGVWVYTLFTQSRGIGAVAAGQWVSIYWASFTIGRIFFGAIISRVNTLVLLRVCMIGVLIGALLLWWNPLVWIGFAGLTLLGFAQAPLFPVLVSATPNRVGVANAANVIGFQVAGAGVGIAALPALAGFLVQTVSPETLAPFIVVAGVLLIVLHELSVAQGVRIAQRAAAAPAGD